MNVKLGKYNQLKVVKEVDFGVYPMETMMVKYCCRPVTCPMVANRMTCSMCLSIWITKRLIATTLQPLVQVGEFACPRWHGSMNLELF